MGKKRIPPRSRQDGLLLWYLLYRVPVDAGITEAVIEKARQHCKMPPARLRELREGALSAHWERMMDKRGRRLAWYQHHGAVEDGWTPPLPGEQDKTRQVLALRLYRLRTAPIRAKGRKHRDGKNDRKMEWLATKLRRTRNIRSPQRRMQALNAIEGHLFQDMLADRLTPEQFDALRHMQRVDHPGRGRKGDQSREEH